MIRYFCEAPALASPFFGSFDRVSGFDKSKITDVIQYLMLFPDMDAWGIVPSRGDANAQAERGCPLCPRADHSATRSPFPQAAVRLCSITGRRGDWLWKCSA